MKPKIALLAASLFACTFFQCRKDKTPTSPDLPADDKLIAAAKQYFAQTILPAAKISDDINPRQKSVKTVDWNRATVVRLQEGQAVVVPISFQKNLYLSTNLSPGVLMSIDSVSRLLIFQDKRSQSHAEVLTAIPDSSFGNGSTKFSGILTIEDWNGKPITKFKYLSDGSVLELDPMITFAKADTSIGRRSASKAIPTTLTAVCYEIDGYNYSPSDPDGSVYWSESAGCEYQYTPQSLPSVASLSPGGYNTALAAAGIRTIESRILVAGTNNRIADIHDYFKCFTNSSGIDHSYSVSVCVDEPIPGTREPWGITNGGLQGSSAATNIVNCGHTFLILTENDGGHITTRNVGFYPSSVVSPLAPSSQGVLNNDEGHSYSVAVTWQLTNTQFFAILDYVSVGNNSGYMYNLSNNNCTTYDIHALSAAGITTPTTIGQWPGGQGYDPGDYGADLRKIPLGSNMSRTTFPPPSHPNTGICLQLRKLDLNRLTLNSNKTYHATPSPIDLSPVFDQLAFTATKREKSICYRTANQLGQGNQLENL